MADLSINPHLADRRLDGQTSKSPSGCRQQNKSGFTKMVLAIAAAVVKPTQEYLESAFTTIKVKDVYTWCRTKLGESLQALRQQAFATKVTGTEPG